MKALSCHNSMFANDEVLPVGIRYLSNDTMDSHGQTYFSVSVEQPPAKVFLSYKDYLFNVIVGWSLWTFTFSCDAARTVRVNQAFHNVSEGQITWLGSQIGLISQYLRTDDGQVFLSAEARKELNASLDAMYINHSKPTLVVLLNLAMNQFKNTALTNDYMLLQKVFADNKALFPISSDEFSLVGLGKDFDALKVIDFLRVNFSSVPTITFSDLLAKLNSGYSRYTKAETMYDLLVDCIGEGGGGYASKH